MKNDALKIIGRHRIRATFYHLSALVFLFITTLYLIGEISEELSYLITACLFVIDYVAEMYDPNPDAPGPWYRHFHRAIDNEE